LVFNDLKLVASEIAPLILPYSDNIGAVRFDALMNAIELAYLVGKPNNRYFKELRTKAMYLSQQTTIPDVAMKMDTIRAVLKEGYVENADIPGLERIRTELRDIMIYLRIEQKLFCDTHFTDQILDIKINESELTDDGLARYRERAEHYIRKNQDEDVIKKLRTNQPLDGNDAIELEKILWSEIGTKEEYEAEFGNKPLGLFVREISGLDIKAAQEAFSKYLNNSDLNTKQQYFVGQIVEYVVRNGVMTDLNVLTESPFTDRGSIVELFTDTSIWRDIKRTIDRINKNVEVHSA
jgi:type I restriction enzyme R subunit